MRSRHLPWAGPEIAQPWKFHSLAVMLSIKIQGFGGWDFAEAESSWPALGLAAPAPAGGTPALLLATLPLAAALLFGAAALLGALVATVVVGGVGAVLFSSDLVPLDCDGSVALFDGAGFFSGQSAVFAVDGDQTAKVGMTRRSPPHSRKL